MQRNRPLRSAQAAAVTVRRTHGRRTESLVDGRGETMVFLRVDGQEVCGRGAIRAAPSDRANRCGPPQYGTYSSEVWLGVPKTDSAIIVMKASQQRLRCDSAEALNRPMDRGIDVFAYHYN